MLLPVVFIAEQTLEDITFLRRRASHQASWVGHSGLPMNDVPEKYLSLKVDAEEMVRKATLLVRSPRE